MERLGFKSVSGFRRFIARHPNFPPAMKVGEGFYARVGYEQEAIDEYIRDFKRL